MARKVLHTLHLWLGLISGTLLVLVALTGCVLAFEDELRYLTQHDLLYVEAEERPQLNVEQILSIVKQRDAHIRLNQIRYLGADRAVLVYTRDKKIISVNPYTGTVLGMRDTKKDPLSVILSFHRTLLLDKTGAAIVYWNVWIFLFMLVSGLLIWLPRKLKQMRQNFSLKLKAAPKKRNYDLHRMLGFYAWVPLFLIAITGISMASGGEKGAKMQSTVHGPQSTAAGSSIYDRTLAEVYHQEPYDMLRVTFPADSTGVINIGIRYQTSGFRKQSNFLFDQYSGKLLKTESYQDKSFGQMFFGSSYEIHTGRILGIPGKIVMFLAGLIALSLPVTGFLIWRGKVKRSMVDPPALEASFGGQGSPR